MLRSVGNPKHALNVSGSLYIPLVLPVARPDLALVNAQLIYPARDYLGFPRGETLLNIRHPLTTLLFNTKAIIPVNVSSCANMIFRCVSSN